MKGLLVMMGMSVGGWAGWALGAPISLFTAFILSVCGTGLGLYLTKLFIQRHLL